MLCLLIHHVPVKFKILLGMPWLPVSGMEETRVSEIHEI